MPTQLPQIFPPRKTPEEVAFIVQRTIGPIIFNVVAAATDLPRAKQLQEEADELKKNPVKKKQKKSSSTSSSHTGGGIPVHEIAWLCKGLQNKLFASPCTLAIRTGDKKLTLSIFEKAKFVVTGAANENVALQGIHNTLEYIARKTGIECTAHCIRVTNIQAIVYMHARLHLKQVFHHLVIAANAQYNVQMINMVKIILEDPKVTVLIYPSGNCVLTGASTRAQLELAKQIVVPFLAQFVISSIHDPEEQARITKKTEQILERLEKPDP